MSSKSKKKHRSITKKLTSKNKQRKRFNELDNYRKALLKSISPVEPIDIFTILLTVVKSAENNMMKFEWSGLTTVKTLDEDEDEIQSYKDITVRVDRVINQPFRLFGGIAMKCLIENEKTDDTIDTIDSLNIKDTTDIDVEFKIPEPVLNITSDYMISSLTDINTYTELSYAYISTLYRILYQELTETFKDIHIPGIIKVDTDDLKFAYDQISFIGNMALIQLRLPELNMIKIQLLVSFIYKGKIYIDNILELVNNTHLSSLHTPVTDDYLLTCTYNEKPDKDSKCTYNEKPDKDSKCTYNEKPDKDSKCTSGLAFSLYDLLRNTLNTYLDKSYNRDTLSKYKMYLHGNRIIYLIEYILKHYQSRSENQRLLYLILKFAVKIKLNHNSKLKLGVDRTINLSKFIHDRYALFCWTYHDKLIPINSDLLEFKTI